MYDVTVIGGGIVGLSVGMALMERYPKAQVLVLEKENGWAMHQTGHNSGVIHSGIYYTPGSLKAKLAKQGNRSMVQFCEENGIEYELCGKVIVATEEKELPLLQSLFQRGLANGLELQMLSPEALREREPHVAGLSAIHVPQAGIVNYRQVADAFATRIVEQGGELRLGQCVEGIQETAAGVEVITQRDRFLTHHVINCGGLHSDRIAALSKLSTGMKIFPFRGEYYELVPEKRFLVRHLVYPVPNPSFPFLGVHFTRMIGGKVEAGPNAVLSFKREGYRKTDFHWGDFTEMMTYPGFWKLARKYWREGLEEMVRSYRKTAFVKSLQRLVPEVQSDDLIAAPAGIRAQALKPDGGLVDDFYITSTPRCIHVCNAPSPAATASIEIGKAILDRIPQLARTSSSQHIS